MHKSLYYYFPVDHVDKELNLKEIPAALKAEEQCDDEETAYEIINVYTPQTTPYDAAEYSTYEVVRTSSEYEIPRSPR